MNNKVTFEGEQFDILIEGSDIILQGMHRDIELTGAYEDLKNECIDEIKFPVWNGDYMESDWIPDHVENMVNDRLADYAAEIANTGTVINHNVN